MKQHFQLFLTTALISLFSLAVFGQNGTIKGKLSDGSNGEPLMFANIFVPEVNTGAQSDFEGVYEISIAPGTYTLEISSVGFANINITDVEVKAGEVTIIDYVVQEEAVTVDLDITVKATTIKRSENAMLTLRKKALTIQNSISSEGISKYAAADAADAVKRTTGTSVVGGKYVYVRGLGDRYSNAQMNGMPLPSTDPYRNSTQLDLIPSNLLDNIVLSKTFLPDQPGDFAGGSVNIGTKSYPEAFTLSAGTSFTYNTQSSFNDGFLTHEGGENDWLGYDDGSRALDPYLTSPEYTDRIRTSSYLRARRVDSTEIRSILDRSAKLLNPQGAPTQTNSFMNHGLSFSVGNSHKLFGNTLGYGFGVSYKRSYQHYENADQNYFEIQGETLNPFYEFNDTRSIDNPSLSGLFTLGYKIGKTSDIQFNALYNNDAQKSSRLLQGVAAEVEGIFTSRALEWRQRTLQGYQLNFQHTFGESGIKLEAGGQIVNMEQDEPDIRFVADQNIYDEDDEVNIYEFNEAQFDLPLHIWRNLQDEQKSAKFDLTIPDLIDKKTDSTKLNLMFKVGAAYNKKDRAFSENSYILNNPNAAVGEEYNGDPNEYFQPSNVGSLGLNDAGTRYNIGLYWRYEDKVSLANSYNGTEEVLAGYAMGVLEYNKFKAILGVRAENTQLFAASQDTSRLSSPTDTTSFLPSVNLVYAVNDRMNIRGSYTRTLARPNMREIAPFSAADYAGGFILSGNANLKLTDITNYDLRWEWFPGKLGSGELVSVSAFYKRFENPIVTSFLVIAANPELQYTNVDEAKLYGIELEFRKNLGFITPALDKLKFITNLTIIKSTSDIPTDEVEVIEQFNPSKGSTRPFYGQSPYIINAALNYDNDEIGLDATLAFNIFGERIVQIAEAANPDVYEQPRAQVDFTLNKKLSDRWSLRFVAKNILDNTIRQTVDFGGEELDVIRFKRGVDFTFGVAYRL